MIVIWSHRIAKFFVLEDNMIITKTPYRISFFGGGSDYPSWYQNYEGKVISSTINKYLYISSRYLPSFFKHKYRIAWSKIEETKNINQIKHNAVRQILNYFKNKKGLEIHYDGDLPARSGMGSSSCFVVGLLKALYELQNKKSAGAGVHSYNLLAAVEAWYP